MYRVLNKRRKILIASCLLVVIILLTVWAVKFYSVNEQAFRQEIQYYSIGETVELENNFFFDSQEHTDGYSICVNSAKLADYTKLMEKYGEPINGEFIPKYVCLLNITVKNVGNTNGYFNALGFSLYDGALQIPVDFEVWNVIDESIDGNIILKLRENTEETLTLPFTVQTLDESVDAREVYRRLENDTFNFVVCDFPVRKLIKVKF